MTLIIYTVNVSPHVIPFVEEVRRQRPDITIKYIARGFAGLRPVEKNSPKKGWGDFCKADYLMRAADDWEGTRRLLKECDVLFCGFRETEIFEERVKTGRLTYYNGERWLKRYAIFNRDMYIGPFHVAPRLPGMMRWLSSNFRKMVRRFVKLTESEKFVFLGIGTYAVRDFVRLRRIVAGNWRALFKCPEIPVDRHLMSEVDGCPQIRLWGYFVAPSKNGVASDKEKGTTADDRANVLKLLWVGRMLHWKRVDTVIQAVKGDDRFKLTILGSGDDEGRLRRLSRGCDNIVFHEPEDLPGVRRVMRENDVLVLSSNLGEGWGAVASEAIEEGVKVVGTYEAGSTATMLPETNLYHAGDVDGLRTVLLSGKIATIPPDAWSARRAATEFIKDMETRLGKK